MLQPYRGQYLDHFEEWYIVLTWNWQLILIPPYIEVHNTSDVSFLLQTSKRQNNNVSQYQMQGAVEHLYW